MFSIITPLDTNRLEQFKETKKVYDSFPQVKEFLIPTRSIDEVSEYLKDNDLKKDVKLLPYTVDDGFNPSKAFNLGVKNAKYDRIIITSPEVKPLTNVLEQYTNRPGENILALVYDEDIDGNRAVLVAENYRFDTPAMYFLAVFNKADIEAINGWDEDFMRGYAYEDNDFGARWVRAGLSFTIDESILAVHQYHPRGETINGGISINESKFKWNTEHGVVRPLNGLNFLGEK